jgi:HSP20 family protein
MEEKAKIQHVPIKMYRTPDRLMIAVPMPGLQPEDIIVRVTEDSHIVIQGEVRGLLKDIKELLVDEWSVGVYYRQIELPNPVDGEHANINYGNGVLVVALPASERTIAADLALEKVGTDRGERVGHSGHIQV